MRMPSLVLAYWMRGSMAAPFYSADASAGNLGGTVILSGQGEWARGTTPLREGIWGGANSRSRSRWGDGRYSAKRSMAQATPSASLNPTVILSGQGEWA